MKYGSLTNIPKGLSSVILLAFVNFVSQAPVLAEDYDQDAAKNEAVAAMQTWLGEIDAGSYNQSWSDAAPSFQQAVTSDQWTSALNGVRTPLGKSIGRKLASAAYQVVPSKDGNSSENRTLTIAQFDSSFENMKYARETVTFEEEADGSWRAAGYFIKPL